MGPVHHSPPLLSLQQLNEVHSPFAYWERGGGGLFVPSAKGTRIIGYVKGNMSPVCSWDMMFVEENETEVVSCDQSILGLGGLINKLQVYTVRFKVKATKSHCHNLHNALER